MVLTIAGGSSPYCYTEFRTNRFSSEQMKQAFADMKVSTLHECVFSNSSSSSKSSRGEHEQTPHNSDLR